MTNFVPCLFISITTESTGIIMLNLIHWGSTTSKKCYNARAYEQFIRPTDVGISFQDSLSKFKYQSSPIIQSSQSVE